MVERVVVKIWLAIFNLPFVYASTREFAVDLQGNMQMYIMEKCARAHSNSYKIIDIHI